MNEPATFIGSNRVLLENVRADKRNETSCKWLNFT